MSMTNQIINGKKLIIDYFFMSWHASGKALFVYLSVKAIE
jgi:hypothetical protein